jgi:hypothetical protein
MKLNQKTPGIIIVKNLKIGIIIISVLLIIFGISFLISNFSNFNLNEINSYIGPILIIIGIIIIFNWTLTISTFDKNQNILTIFRRTIRNKYERKYTLNDIKEINYSEYIGNYNNSGRNRGARPSQININKIVTINLQNGERHIIYQTSGRYNPFMYNKTKNNAQVLANFLGLPLTSNTPGEFIKNIGNQIFNPNNQQQNINQTPNFNQNNNQFNQNNSG